MPMKAPLVLACIYAAIATSSASTQTKKRIAVIGGGISGSFSARYLSQYDSSCQIDSITIFDPSPITSHDPTPTGELGENRQGGRVSWITLPDGQVVELGASIIHSANRLVREVVDADEDLVAVPPFHSGKRTEDGIVPQTHDGDMPRGFGIWDGEKWALLTSKGHPFLQKLKVAWRYNTDIMKLSRAASRALTSFELIYDFLDSNVPFTFFSSADDLWKVVGLWDPTQMTFDDYLDSIGVSGEGFSWRKYLPAQGSLRDELAVAMNLCNYNQNNVQLNGLVGMVSFLPSGGDLFSIQGGNAQIISSALQQASNARSHCNNNSEVQHIQKTVTKVISSQEKMDLWSGDEHLGAFDIVILAAPLQQCQTDFYVQNNDTLRPMPFPSELPPSATRSYTQVVTTVVSNATSLHAHFHTTRDSMPRSICANDRGKEKDGFTCLTQITPDGVYKMFTSDVPSDEYLQNLYGPGVQVIYKKNWGGRFGGATPDYSGAGEASTALPFLLYEENRDGPALYYINSIEAAAAAIEISAIGSKIVSKLVAERLGIIQKTEVGDTEL